MTSSYTTVWTLSMLTLLWAASCTVDDQVSAPAQDMARRDMAPPPPDAGRDTGGLVPKDMPPDAQREMGSDAGEDMPVAADMPPEMSLPLKECGEPGKHYALRQDLFGPLSAQVKDWEECTVLLGDVADADVTEEDVAQLRQLREIRGKLAILRGRQMPDARAFSNLERISGPFSLRSVDELQSLQGLERLEEVSGRFTITINPRLKTLQGLDKLRVVGELDLGSNPELESLEGLKSLKTVRGNVKIDSSQKLTRAQIEEFFKRVEVQGEVDIYDP